MITGENNQKIGLIVLESFNRIRNCITLNQYQNVAHWFNLRFNECNEFEHQKNKGKVLDWVSRSVFGREDNSAVLLRRKEKSRAGEKYCLKSIVAEDVNLLGKLFSMLIPQRVAASLFCYLYAIGASCSL